MLKGRVRRSVYACGVVALLAGALPVAARAALIDFGSGLGTPATVGIADPVDTAFWSTALSAGAKSRAPRSGQVLAVRVRGCAERGSGGQLPLTQIHFQVLSPGSEGGTSIKVTSGPFNLPVCGGPVSGGTVSTFRPVNLCASAGDYVAFNDEGGAAPGVFPRGVAYEVFARSPGAATTSFTGAGATSNGDHLQGVGHQGLELLMQLVLGTGHNAGPACRT